MQAELTFLAMYNSVPQTFLTLDVLLGLGCVYYNLQQQG